MSKVPDKAEKNRIYKLKTLFLKVIARNGYSLTDSEKKVFDDSDLNGIRTLAQLIMNVAAKNGYIPNQNERKEMNRILKSKSNDEYSFYTSNASRPIQRRIIRAKDNC